MIRRLRRHFLLSLLTVYSRLLLCQVQQVGSIAGQLRLVSGDTPPQQVMVELRLHGATVNNTYTDGQGRFSFTNLDPDSYQIVIRDDSYAPVDELVSLRPESPVAYLQIVLRPRQTTANLHSEGSAVSGGNQFLIDRAAYTKHFPRKAIKEYDKGLDADRHGDHERAIAHYQAAVSLAPDFYPAHNNLGSDYLTKSDIADARKEFEEVVRLNQSDAAGYFNLSHVSLLTGKLDEAQQFLNEGLRREPDSALGQFLVGSLAMRIGKYPEAESALRRAIQISPVMTQA